MIDIVKVFRAIKDGKLTVYTARNKVTNELEIFLKDVQTEECMKIGTISEKI